MGAAIFLRNRLIACWRSLAAMEKTFTLYAWEGVLIAAALNLVNNNNNLFANRLGAGDYQLSLLSLLPQLVNMLVLIPGGIVTDSLRNKRKMVIGSVALTAVFYAAIGLLPFFVDFNITAFLVLLSAATGAFTLHSISWQAYFPEVIAIEKRNAALTVRTIVSVFAGIVIPIVSGFLLAALHTNSAKIVAHQGFFLASAALIFSQICILRQINPRNVTAPTKIHLDVIKKAGVSLLHNKKLLLYAAVAGFLYIAWQMDITLYYIGQTQYLLLNEAQLSLVTVGGTTAQFLTLRSWSRMNEKRDVVYTMTFGILGLAACPAAMNLATSLPATVNQYVFILMHTIANIGCATLSLNLFQCLLQVLDERYRTLCISIFTALISFISAVMPIVGVAVYKSFGGSLPALQTTNWLIFTLRLLAAGLWLLRWIKIVYGKR